MASPPLITCYRQTTHEQREVCCSIKTSEATAVVLAVLGTLMLVAGIYLSYGGIGTIPATMGGFLLSLAGIASIVASIVLTAKS